MTDIIVLGLNRFGQEVYEWLLQRSDTNVQAVITEQSQFDTVRKLDPELIISAGFRYIVPDSILKIPELGAVNLHPSYLPYNRGANPNVWSIMESNPAGVSIHYMTSRVDCGPIIARRKVPVRPEDNGQTLYRRLEDAQVEIFTENWAAIREGDANTVEQNTSDGNSHRMDDFSEMFEIDRGAEVQAGELIDQLRALTFPPYKNAYFVLDRDKYYVDIDITPESEVEASESIHFNIPNYV